MTRRISNILSRLRRFARHEGGGTLAELAILVPFLVVMMATVVELGRFFQTYSTISKATRSAARHLSNHNFDATEINKAKNLAACGLLYSCAEGEEIVPGLSTANICVESVGTPVPTTVTVRVPRNAGDCGDVEPFVYEPIFDIGGILGSSISLALPFSPSTTMYYMLDN